MTNQRLLPQPQQPHGKAQKRPVVRHRAPAFGYGRGPTARCPGFGARRRVVGREGIFADVVTSGRARCRHTRRSLTRTINRKVNWLRLTPILDHHPPYVASAPASRRTRLTLFYFYLDLIATGRRVQHQQNRLRGVPLAIHPQNGRTRAPAATAAASGLFRHGTSAALASPAGQLHASLVDQVEDARLRFRLTKRE